MALTWIASYPKSGNTWVRVLLASYLRDRQVDLRLADLGHIDDAVPDLADVLRRGRVLPLDRPGPLAVKTHFLPGMSIHDPYRTATTKVIYLVRNPRDVMLSAERMLHVVPERRTAFAAHFIAHCGVQAWQRTGYGRWTDSVREWTSPQRLRACFPATELLVLRYEDIKDDTAGALRRVVEFLEFDTDVDDERVRRAVEHSALDRMRAAERGDASLGHLQLRPFFGQGLSAQSLTGYGEQVEADYQRLVAQDDEFGRLVEAYGYAAVPATKGS